MQAIEIEISKKLKYWRISLADSALGDGKFSQRDRKRFIEVSGETVRSGKLPEEILDKVFGEQTSAKSIAVRFWPLVMARKSSHGAALLDGLPEIVAPVVTEATIYRDGQITPVRNALARDVLSPLPSGEFSIGSVDDLDDFLTETPLPDMIVEESWPDYLRHCRKMVDAVAEGWPNGDEHYQSMGFGFLEPAEDASATVRNILDLYDKLLSDKPDAPLLSQIVAPCKSTCPADPTIEYEFSRRLGHSNPHFPLSAQQRQVLAYLDASSLGEVVAVNGPPGTGKTTMLLSAVASLWIKAALKGENPPVIVAASTNNQAVTNIIDSFGKDFAKGEGPFAGRWLPDIRSFGIFLPSHSRKMEAAKKYQTEDFQTACERLEYFSEAKDEYLKAAQAAFPALSEVRTELVVEAIHIEMVKEANKLSELDDARKALAEAEEAVKAALGEKPAETETVFAKTAEEAQQIQKRAKAAKTALETHLATEPTISALFSFLPAIKKKRMLSALQAIHNFMPDADGFRQVEDVEVHVTESLRAAEESTKHADLALAKARRLRSSLKEAESRWKRAKCVVVDKAEGLDLESAADIGVRFRLFLLATHYWEGRWLLAMEEDLARITGSANKTGKATLVPRWQRRMMLSPCAVATFASLPGKLTYSRKAGGKWAKEYLYEFIDLLIVDEAGQVLPEVCGASYSLAKRALVIGDTQQIEPISSVPKPVDIGNLREVGLLKNDDDWNALSEKGFSTSTGSAMRVAQEGCRVSPYPELEKGLYLFEHRRCFDQIIGYSNALCYKGKLRPLRGPVPADAKLPGLGYLHVDGRAIRFGSSRANLLEARTIAAWLDANRSELERRYQARLEQIVGVVTPFGRQVREIRAACASRGISVDVRDGMTIGTVHSLQGAERPVVIFSPVYSKHADGHFIDASTSMLNVTVSRAKDSCLVFGDMDVLTTAAPGSPRSMLGDFLFNSTDNALEFETEPRSDLQEGGGGLQMLRDAAEHDTFLVKALAGNGRQYSIVSPWIIARTMQNVGFLDAFGKAINRGATIDVFSDPLLNTNMASDRHTQMSFAKDTLTKIGVKLHEVPRLHSKIVAVDKDLLAIGSYNWLSADRNGKYARHETSFVYRGQHLEPEINTIFKSLGGRER
ncbi:AAA domain-containing protein [Shimia thalassica]|uniref:AAA domain-containing protein n=1 Tax=Shimia thalassica TaxID=1715693 RepID=UPI001C097C12|nr:AAA domain-containing protein [Shimia thalassica]MBU2941049.1 AAA family ATPase [Shimia thalassica]MDO6505260.1 AAA domain-containing protein [Shimia thalassica]